MTENTGASSASGGSEAVLVEPSSTAPSPYASPEELVSDESPPRSNADGGPDQADEVEISESVQQPAKVMRIGSMVKQLLDEVRSAGLDEASRTRLREIHEQSVRELAGALSPDLAQELDRMALPFDESTPSEAELRVAQAQLVGWLEGLFHGIQATLLAQQMAARAQLDQMRQRGLPSGLGPSDGAPPARPGTYL